jgi:hypothetical protein
MTAKQIKAIEEHIKKAAWRAVDHEKSVNVWFYPNGTITVDFKVRTLKMEALYMFYRELGEDYVLLQVDARNDMLTISLGYKGDL